MDRVHGYLDKDKAEGIRYTLLHTKIVKYMKYTANGKIKDAYYRTVFTRSFRGYLNLFHLLS